MPRDAGISTRLKTGLAVAGAIGAGVAVIKALFHEDRPTIRVRNGGSIHVDTERGDFVADGIEWRQRAPGTKGPRTLEVEVSHAGGPSQFEGRFVLIVYLVGGMERRLVITVQKRYLGLFGDQIYVAAGSGAVVQHRGPEVVLEPGTATRLLRIAVGAKPDDPRLGRVVFEDRDAPEIDIHPRR